MNNTLLTFSDQISFSFADIKEICGGVWQNEPKDQTVKLSSISSDSRNFDADIFVALKGESFDAHKFLHQVADRSKLIFVETIDKTVKATQLKVTNTLTAYQDLANAHRQKLLNTQIIGITGSCGKTSTKEMIAAVCEYHYGKEAVYFTQANTNNLIGAAQNLLKVSPLQKIAILELGTNAPGEIKRLTEITEPDIRIITNIGHGHLEGLNDIEGVSYEKAAILSTNLKTTQHTIVNQSCLKFLPVKKFQEVHSLLTYGLQSDSDFKVIPSKQTWASSNFNVKHTNQSYSVSWEISGIHMMENAGSAFAVAKILSIDFSKVTEALSAFKLPGMRMRSEKVAEVTVLNDAYNANPESMKALIIWLSELDINQKNLHLVLGDMLELGDEGPKLHSDMIDFCHKRLPKIKLYLVGEIFNELKLEKSIQKFSDSEVAAAKIVPQINTDDILILKGSRGTRLEKIEQYLKDALCLK
ncbi:MAG: UDP-N-acetylmuramoyl-tripeptide--D-alanyl-D-alanine ligase [Lentisphaeria bacterium]|nr:UDP-N-acetylmuramoyl-tripeptide--D-alanyl-D-alanine ligase [Lentisphaeria bacterium]